ncbi:cytidine deaminase-like protein [Coemansia reversa NRRL 1564]|uniref:Cytidine deaminase-like protein n=1 Tax=Coemansia reversa (strain ATCC 12441 / NRRL 1564) TaxID=763665 RepID=A0A2G5BJW5_COERN|nr:cytidine deaminase-like protein [Coemansia reversa NRRL 1564]|eukprot:PIA19305.1 cytidine deaminase-like protein [Coemansia reversa NRRL 1564]
MSSPVLPAPETYRVIDYDNGSDEVEAHIEFMELAIQQAKLAQPIDSAFSVGSLLVSGRQIITTGYSRELPGNTHAAQCTISKSKHTKQANLVRGSVLYTTMEPCSFRLSGNTPCSTHIINAGIKQVVIGVKEPDTFSDCHGVARLIEAGINVIHLKILEEECLRPNIHLLS